MDFVDLFDYIGTFAFALSGIKLAAVKKFDLFGAFVAGAVTAIGGGTLRDVMLKQSPFWILDYKYLLITGIALVSYILLRRYFQRFNNALLLFDAIGLAFFTVVGFQKTLDAGFSLWAATVMGTFTGAAGGVLRDVLLNDAPLIFKEDIYAMACIVGGGVFSVLCLCGVPLSVTQISCALTVFLVRMFALKFKWRLPVLVEP